MDLEQHTEYNVVRETWLRRGTSKYGQVGHDGKFTRILSQFMCCVK